MAGVVPARIETLLFRALHGSLEFRWRHVAYLTAPNLWINTVRSYHLSVSLLTYPVKRGCNLPVDTNPSTSPGHKDARPHRRKADPASVSEETVGRTGATRRGQHDHPTLDDVILGRSGQADAPEPRARSRTRCGGGQARRAMAHRQLHARAGRGGWTTATPRAKVTAETLAASSAPCPAGHIVQRGRGDCGHDRLATSAFSSPARPITTVGRWR